MTTGAVGRGRSRHGGRRKMGRSSARYWWICTSRIGLRSWRSSPVSMDYMPSGMRCSGTSCLEVRFLGIKMQHLWTVQLTGRCRATGGIIAIRSERFCKNMSKEVGNAHPPSSKTPSHTPFSIRSHLSRQYHKQMNSIRKIFQRHLTVYSDKIIIIVYSNLPLLSHLETKVLLLAITL